MRKVNPNFGIKFWKKGQRMSSVQDLRTGFILYWPKQRNAPAGRQVDENILRFMSNVQPPPEPEPLPPHITVK